MLHELDSTPLTTNLYPLLRLRLRCTASSCTGVRLDLRREWNRTSSLASAAAAAPLCSCLSAPLTPTHPLQRVCSLPLFSPPSSAFTMSAAAAAASPSSPKRVDQDHAAFDLGSYTWKELHDDMERDHFAGTYGGTHATHTHTHTQGRVEATVEVEEQRGGRCAASAVSAGDSVRLQTSHRSTIHQCNTCTSATTCTL